MSKDQVYGVRVEIEEISATLFDTRVMRLALEVMWDRMTQYTKPEQHQGQTSVLVDLDKKIRDMELAVLRDKGLAKEFLIIRPLSPISPPPPETIQKISAAIRTLADLGLLVGQDDVFNTAKSPRPD
jgi:hypothetical protein